MDWRAFGTCQVRELANQGWIEILENRKIHDVRAIRVRVVSPWRRIPGG